MLNISGQDSPSGDISGSFLGFLDHHWMSGNSNIYPYIVADFEVDYGFAFYAGGGADVYFDAGKYIYPRGSEYQGALSVSNYGTSTKNNDASITGKVFTKNSIEWSYNAGGGNNGIELKIPFSEIGATSSMSIEVFAFLVDNKADFSNVTIPGNLSRKIGTNPDFTSEGVGPFHSSPASPLPVELISFTAVPQNNSVNLIWETATELNNYGFEVQREKIKDQSEDEWESIGFVQGHGTTNSPKDYEFTDSELPNSESVDYRLKQIDNDGTFAYSKTITVDLTTITNVDEEVVYEFALEQNYPNPFNPSTTIKFTVPTPPNPSPYKGEGAREGLVLLRVYDILGREVATLINEEKPAGSYSVAFNAANLPSGIYFYKIEAGNFVEVKKMTLLK
jgi:hypothetical protein